MGILRQLNLKIRSRTQWNRSSIFLQRREAGSEAGTKGRKKERIAMLLENVDAAQPQPVIDFLGD